MFSKTNYNFDDIEEQMNSFESLNEVGLMIALDAHIQKRGAKWKSKKSRFSSKTSKKMRHSKDFRMSEFMLAI